MLIIYIIELNKKYFLFFDNYILKQSNIPVNAVHRFW
uniref:Uncharacterized protein n=1 Tax=Myoviridae sp. ctJ2i1 TaxID=2825079 RepID=A0A8S5V239_9CAUD|nr:MAG TPA: hypothetical protein [Myoviridae sp. ctJ2i1]